MFGMARKNEEYTFDFVGKPLRYRIMDGITNMRRENSRKKLEQENDEVIYFKTESVKTVLGETRYVVFYNSSGFVSPFDSAGKCIFSPKQENMIINTGKGYIARNTVRNEYRGWVKNYTIVPYERAHSYPASFNLDKLIAKGMVLPLQ